MGLDITAYQRLTPDKDGKIQLWINGDFPGRAAPFDDADLRFTAKQAFSFRAGSYSGYNLWRDQLAKLAGYPETDHPAPHRKGERSHAAFVWGQEPRGLPFEELVNFADNEGTLGTTICQKLLKDFKEFDQRAKEFSEDSWFYLKYQDWAYAIALAADGGAVQFL